MVRIRREISFDLKIIDFSHSIERLWARKSGSFLSPYGITEVKSSDTKTGRSWHFIVTSLIRLGAQCCRVMSFTMYSMIHQRGDQARAIVVCV